MSPRTVTPLPSPTSRDRASTLGASPWIWMMLTCALFAASRGVRGWQDHRFDAALRRSGVAAFPLEGLPAAVGEWRLQEGSETKLDPKIARIAGGTNHLVRTYAHRSTGVSLTVLVLFGPAQTVSLHTPAVCYPSAGYESADGPMRHTIDLGPGRKPALVRSEVFTRGEGDSAEREEVYHTFRYGRRWTPDAADDWKRFRHDPRMFKVQTRRPVAEHERRLLDNPTEQFLGLFLAEIERRLTGNGAGPKD